MPPRGPDDDCRPIGWQGRSERIAALLTPELIDAWLAGHLPDQTVGRRLDLRACPVACYLSERTGQTWLVNGIWAERADPSPFDGPVYLSAWLVDYSKLIDAHPEQTLTAADARDYLMMAVRLQERHSDPTE